MSVNAAISYASASGKDLGTFITLVLDNVFLRQKDLPLFFNGIDFMRESFWFWCDQIGWNLCRSVNGGTNLL